MDNKKINFTARISQDTLTKIQAYHKWGKRFRSQSHFIEMAVDYFIDHLENKS